MTQHEHNWVPFPGLANFPQRLCECGAVKAREMKVGDNTIGFASDIMTWSATASPTTAGQMGMNTTTGRPQAYIGGSLQSLAHTGELTGAPGTWTQLGKGPTSVADNTEVTVLAGQSLSAGEIPVFHAAMRSTPTATVVHYSEDTSAGIGGGEFRSAIKKQTSGNFDFTVKKRDSGSQDVDWVVHKVTPS